MAQLRCCACLTALLHRFTESFPLFFAFSPGATVSIEICIPHPPPPRPKKKKKILFLCRCKALSCTRPQSSSAHQGQTLRESVPVFLHSQGKTPRISFSKLWIFHATDNILFVFFFPPTSRCGFHPFTPDHAERNQFQKLEKTVAPTICRSQSSSGFV